jgi:hypothetical protein
MGDNRDNSLDSREQRNAVGFIPVENLVGRAEFIFFSVDGSARFWEIWAWPTAIRYSVCSARSVDRPADDNVLIPVSDDVEALAERLGAPLHPIRNFSSTR